MTVCAVYIVVKYLLLFRFCDFCSEILMLIYQCHSIIVIVKNVIVIDKHVIVIYVIGNVVFGVTDKVVIDEDDIVIDVKK